MMPSSLQKPLSKDGPVRLLQETESFETHSRVGGEVCRPSAKNLAHYIISLFMVLTTNTNDRYNFSQGCFILSGHNASPDAL
eukprot:132646-Pelagomonas_calceolata.AAC.5